MALPSSGPISLNDMNTDRGIASGTQIDLATAGNAYGVSYTTNGSNDLQFFEFYGLSITTPAPTPAPTPPPTPPPTPAPTPAPLTITNSGVTCFGAVGSFTSTIAGGSGTYDWIAIATSPADASNAVNGISGTRYAASPNPYQWSNISNGTYYVAVKDSDGTVTVQTLTVTVSCTTPAPTPPSQV